MRFILALLICAFATVACAEDLSFVVACAADGKCGTAIGPTRIEGKVARSAMAQCKKLSLRPNSCRGQLQSKTRQLPLYYAKNKIPKMKNGMQRLVLERPEKTKVFALSYAIPFKPLCKRVIMCQISAQLT